MRNRYTGKCSLCGKSVAPKQGRWHEEGYEKFGSRNAQRFSGLRCLSCSTTTKKGKKTMVVMIDEWSKEDRTK